MSVCVQCGIERDDGALLCPQHERESLDTWAEGNRIICDWIHRGKLPERAPEPVADDETWIKPWTPEVLRPFADDRRALAAPAGPGYAAAERSAPSAE